MIDLLTHARFSQLIYQDWKFLRRYSVGIGYPHFQYWDHGDTQAALVWDHNKAALIFRGTEFSIFSLRDVFSNLGTLEPWAGEGQAHTGYVSAFNRVRDKILKKVETLGTPVDVTGHSLGGALATLFAAWQPEVVNKIVTFGSPRVGDTEFVEHYQKGTFPTVRVVNKMDFAPNIPLKARGFKHVGPALSVNSETFPMPVSRHRAENYAKGIIKWKEDGATSEIRTRP